MADLLVVEDDRDLAASIGTTLEAFGHHVSMAYKAGDVMALVQGAERDLLLIDLGLPDGDGKDVVRDVRAMTDVPIIVLTSRSEIEERVAALDAGADDYVLKPFSTDELAARVRAQIRRAAGVPSPGQCPLRFEGLEIDLAANQVRRDGDLVRFTPTELKMLVLLASSANQLVTHRQLYGQVWPDGSAESGHYVRVYIQQIRRKLGDDPRNPTFIATEMSYGYRWLPRPVGDAQSS